MSAPDKQMIERVAAEATPVELEPVPNPSVRPGARRAPVDEALAFLRANRDTHTRWAEFFEQNPEVEKEYVATGVWEGAADQRRIERQYNAAIATFEALSAITPPNGDEVREALEALRLCIPIIEEEREVTVYSHKIGYPKHPDFGKVIDPDALADIAKYDAALHAARAALAKVEP